MKKSLIAAAVLGTAFTASAQVTLSGRASMEVGRWEATGATAGAASDFRARTRVADTGSRIAFAVNESLGGGLNAKIYCETGVNIDNGSNLGQAGTVNSNTSEWCSREGHLAIGNSMVEVRLGRQNVWWTQGDLNDVGSRWLGHDVGTNLFTSSTVPSGTTTPTGGVGVYGVRLENMIKLVAGSAAGAFAGSELYHGFMGNSGAQSAAAGAAFPTPVTIGEAAGANASATGKYTGFKVNYSQGQLIGMIDYQTSDRGANDTVGLSERTAYKLGGGYKFAGAQSQSIVTLQYFAREGKSLDGLTKREDSGFIIVGKYALSDGWMALAQWARADSQKLNGATVANSGASGYTLGVTKAFSNRTHMFASYHNLDNQAAASYGLSGGNFQAGSPNLGANSKAFGVGAIHLF